MLTRPRTQHKVRHRNTSQVQTTEMPRACYTYKGDIGVQGMDGLQKATEYIRTRWALQQKHIETVRTRGVINKSKTPFR